MEAGQQEFSGNEEAGQWVLWRLNNGKRTGLSGRWRLVCVKWRLVSGKYGDWSSEFGGENVEAN